MIGPWTRIGGLAVFSLAVSGAACSHPAPPASPGAVASAPAGGASDREDDDDDETPVSQADLPAPVQATVTAQASGATIHRISRSTEDGKVEYELELVLADGHRKDMDIGPGGEILEVEEEVALDHVPDPARSSIQSSAGSRTIHRIEAVSRADGTLRGYEVLVADGDKKAELFVGPDGKVLPDDDED